MSDNETLDVASARQTAIANGLRFYAGSSCNVHPGAMRYVASKACVECAKAARKASAAANAEKDKLRKRAARALQKETAARPIQSSVICEIIGL